MPDADGALPLDYARSAKTLDEDIIKLLEVCVPVPLEPRTHKFPQHSQSFEPETRNVLRFGREVRVVGTDLTRLAAAASTGSRLMVIMNQRPPEVAGKLLQAAGPMDLRVALLPLSMRCAICAMRSVECPRICFLARCVCLHVCGCFLSVTLCLDVGGFLVCHAVLWMFCLDMAGPTSAHTGCVRAQAMTASTDAGSEAPCESNFPPSASTQPEEERAASEIQPEEED
eukprot:3761896-Rhodomonas_salina.2